MKQMYKEQKGFPQDNVGNPRTGGTKPRLGCLRGQEPHQNYLQDNRGWTAVHHASKHSYLQVLEMLIRLGTFFNHTKIN